jgi:DNA-binding cell septation regulator SpoVG
MRSGLRAYVSITFDDCFVISEIKLIRGKKGHAISSCELSRRAGTGVYAAGPLQEAAHKRFSCSVELLD